MNNTIKIQNKATLNANVGANIQLIELQNGSELIVNNKAIHDAALIKAAVDGSGELVLINVNTTADIGEALTKLGKVTFLNLDNAGAGFVALAHDVHANILDIAGTTALKIDNKIQAATTVISSTPDTAKLVVDGNTNVNFNIEGANVEFTGDDDLTVEADKMVNSKVTAAADTGAIIFQGATDSQNLEMGTDAAKLRLVQFSNGAAVGNVDASVYGIFANDITVDDNVSVHAEEFGGNLNLAGVNSAFYLADNGSVSVGNVVRGPGKFYTKGNATIEVDIAAAVWNMEGDDAEVTIHTDISAATVNQTAQNLVLAHDVAFANAYNANGSMITLGTNTLTFNGAATFEGDNFVNLTYNNNTTYGKIIDATRAITINAGATVAVTVTCADETLIAHDAVLTFINTNIVAGDPQDARLTFSFATPEGLINGLSGVTDGNVGTVRINATARDQRIAVEAVRVEAARVEAARVFAEEFARFADMDVDDAADARVAARAEALQVAQAGQAGRAPVGAGNVVERRVVDTIHLPQSCAAIEQKFISLREKHKNATTNEQHNVAAKDHAVVWKELFAEVQKSSSEEWAQNHDAVTQVVQVLADASQNPTTVDNTNKSAKYSYDGLFLFIANDTKTTPERVEHIMNNMDDNNPFALHETAKIVAARETAQHKAVATTAVAHAEMAVHTGITGATTRIASISPITHAPVGGSDLEASAQGIAAGSSAEKHGVWGQVMGGIATQKARKGAAGFKSNMIGSMVGADTMINDNATLGVAFGNVANNVNMKDLQKGDKTRSSSWVFSGYGNYQFDNDFFIRGAVAYTRTAVNNTEKRQITNTQSGLAKAKYNVNSFGGELTVGKAFAAGGVTVIPSVGARLTHTGKISYKEGGNTGLNTAISQGAMNSLYGVAGLQVTKAFVNGDSIITPEAHANVQYGLGMKTPKGKFISQLDNKAVSYVGNKPSRFSADVGCGIMAETGALEYGVAYDANIAAGYVGHQGTVKLKVKF